MDIETTKVEEVTDFDKGQNKDRATRDRWVAEITAVEREREEWIIDSEKVIDVYKDKNTKLPFNILWSNIKTLQPAIYSRTPKPVTERRFKDGQDYLGRCATETVTDSLDFLLDAQDFDTPMEQARDDFLLCGMGQAWVRYESGTYKDVNDETGQEEERLGHENVVVDHIYWKDFLFSTSRSWDEVRWVAKRIYLDRDGLREHFGGEGGLSEEQIKQIPLDHKPRDIKVEEDDKQKDIFSKATIYEVWDKDSLTVYWLAKGFHEKCLKTQDDPLNLTGFFPCPKPLLATVSGESLIPVPDYYFYKKQAELINELSARISAIAEAVRPNGAYDSTFPKLQHILNAENKLVPVDNWQDFVAKGGFDGTFQFLPMESFASTLEILYNVRDRALQSIYELIGLSDIVRGATNPAETATAQQIKGQFASLRLTYKQKEMQRFCRDLVEIMAEIVSENFDEDTLFLMSGVDVKGEEEQYNFSQVVELLRDDVLRQFRIDIETDSTIAVDEQQEREARVNFLNSVGQFFQQGMAFAQSSPSFTPLMGKLLMFGVKSFRAGRVLEDDIELALKNYEQETMQAAQQEPPPDPEMIKLQNQMQIAQMVQQTEMEKLKVELQIEQMKLQAKMQSEGMEGQREQMKTQNEIAAFWEKAKADITEVQQRSAAEAQKVQQQSMAEVQKIQAEIQKMAAEFQLQRERQAGELKLKAYDAQAKQQERREQAQIKQMEAAKPKETSEGKSSGVTIVAKDPSSYKFETLPDGSRKATPIKESE